MLRNLIIVITGPTASGKTAAAIDLAQRLGRAQILSADSRQIYRYMDIGTAKPSAREQEQVVHHFLNIRDPDEQYSAGRYGEEARETINLLWEKGITPIVVGGSGLYIQALVDGFFEEEGAYGQVRPWLRERLQEEGVQALYAELAELDPQAHARLHANDAQRILRALEVAHSSGRSLQEHWVGQEREPLAGQTLMYCLSMERERLYARIEERVEHMLAEGLVGEVEKLRARGYDRRTWALGTLGYAEIFDVLEGASSLQEAVALIKQRTRQYAKRQLTWLRRDRRLRWLEVDRWGKGGVVERVQAQVELWEEGANISRANGGFFC